MLGSNDNVRFDFKIGPVRFLWWRYIYTWPPYIGSVSGEGGVIWFGPLWVEV